MIFALSTDDRTLIVFPDESAAIAYCEGIDVSEAGWLFFAIDGSPLEPEFSLPAKRSGFVVSHGTYFLRLSSRGTGLLELLPSVSAVEGEPPMNTIEGIEQHLSAERKRRSRVLSSLRPSASG